MTGPTVGPDIHSAIAVPLYSRGIMSAIVPPPSASGADPNVPERKRKTISALRFGANPQARLKMQKRTLDI